MMTDNGEEAAVLPAIRISRLWSALHDIMGDREMTQRAMDAVDEHLGHNAYRWGNACPHDGCGAALEWRDKAGHVCPVHGYLGHMAATVLLIGFRPCESPLLGRNVEASNDD